MSSPTATSLPVETDPSAGVASTIAETVEQLRHWFGREFSLLDGRSGDLLHCAVEGSAPGAAESWGDRGEHDWGTRGEVCREVSRRGRPEFIDEQGPFLLLALPIEDSQGSPRVALAPFLSREVRGGTNADEDPACGASLLGMMPAEASRWATEQTVWSPRTLMQMSEVVRAEFASRARIGKLQEEDERISDHLSTTYEEISLLHRLAQNLKLSRSDEDLGRIALEWLHEVIPAQSVAIQLVPLADSDDASGPGTRTAPVLLQHGPRPIEASLFDPLIAHLGVGASSRPLVANHPITGAESWPFESIGQLIVTPLAEGENLFGWLAALNHVDEGGEFGTVEASLLGSVGAILGIHSGNIELYRQQSELLAGVIGALSSAIDAKDPYTCGHSDRVARIAVRLARELGMDPKMLDTIHLCGMLHDIGKIGISDNVLRKPGGLTEDEYKHIMTHPELGHKILVDLKKLDGILPVVLHHHEAWDGSGYPSGLAGEEIPIAARIVAVADSFDAMGSDRPYRMCMPDEKIDAIFRSGAGSQWDPRVVDAFFRAGDDIRAIAAREDETVPQSMVPQQVE